MTNKTLVVQVKRRDALPVRAIPYVTGWKISPDDVARHFAKGIGPPFAQLTNVSAYHLVDNVAVKVMPKEWDAYVAELDGLEAELKSKYVDNDQGYAVWRKHAVSILPEAAFVWLNKFRTEFLKDFSPDKITFIREREGERKLLLAPLMGDDMRAMVLAGFQKDSDPLPQAAMAAESEGAPVLPAAASDDVEPAGASDAGSVDFSMLATRQQLIVAFGTFTNMDATWFHNLRDRPKLRDARRVTGTGGRNRTEPLFCPYQVLKWLTTKPRMGDSRRTMGTTTGWRMLKAHFLKVYSAHSDDPDNDSPG